MHVNTGFRPHFHIIPTPGKRTSPCPEPEETGGMGRRFIQCRFSGVSKSPDDPISIPQFQKRWSEDSTVPAVILFPPLTAVMMIASGGTAGDEYVKHPHSAAIRHQLLECPLSRHSLGLRIHN